MLVSTLLLVYCFTFIYAAPIFSEQNNDIGSVLTDTLSDFYENIIDQVMLDASEDILRYIPESMSQGNIEARHDIIRSMDRNLNFMRASLLASVNPLVSTDIQQLMIKNDVDTLQNELPKLNTKISHQLGLIINAEQTSAILIRQASSIVHKNTKSSSTVTVEWKLRQPFQVNIIHQEQEQAFDASNELQWLFTRLSQVQSDLLTEFNDHVQNAVELLLETLAL